VNRKQVWSNVLADEHTRSSTVLADTCALKEHASSRIRLCTVWGEKVECLSSEGALGF
jgi:hypothetical protein